MCAVPASVAGVERIAVVTPPGEDGAVDKAVLAACAAAGVTEVYRVGGAQAVAALACGTETIPRVDKIVGPGNIFVTLAKKEILGQAGIDMLCGPSEVVVVADSGARADFVAADMLGQAEHGPMAGAVLEYLKKRDAYFGSLTGTLFAEPFFVREPLGLRSLRDLTHGADAVQRYMAAGDPDSTAESL